jgi:hypothetical protein
MTSKNSKPSTDLQALNQLIGTWQLSGDTTGTVKYEWMEGGFFLIQHVDMFLFDRNIKCIEVIGHLQSFGEKPGREIRSRVYDNSGNTLDYVYEMEGNVLTIWGGEKGSLSYFKGKFSSDGTTNTGEWVYPGGGYKSTMKKIA